MGDPGGSFAAVAPFDHHRRCHHKTYRLTCEQFDELYAYAKGCCQICQTPEAETARRVLCIDHAHRYGLAAVRGLLCDRCNRLMCEADKGRYVENAYPYWRKSWFMRQIAAARSA